MFTFEIAVLQETSNKSLVLVKMFSYTTKQALLKQKKARYKVRCRAILSNNLDCSRAKNALPINFLLEETWF